MFRLCFSLLTKCCVGFDGDIDNDEDIGSDCGNVMMTYVPIVKIFRKKLSKVQKKARGSSTVNGVFLLTCFEGRRQYRFALSSCLANFK